ncbi:molybdopterin-dependent oxidoreductase [Chloroflexota bacterium]
MHPNSIVRDEGEETVYSSCHCNCGSDHHCVFKVHIKDGIVVAVEPDDRYNTGVGREDEILSEDDLIKNRLQRRPCGKGLVFHKHLYHPDRVLYPLMRAQGSKRGEGKYIRISWDEALTTIADKMKEIKERYGPYSIVGAYAPVGGNGLFSHFGAGVNSWGMCSVDSIKLASHIVTGVPNSAEAGYHSSSASDMLANSKLIVIWGFDPAMGSMGPGYQFAWFLKLARERGKKVIIFDPRYTPAAEVLADQWIPIKPGTDTAMFMAMAYVLFKQDVWNKEFVARYVEPEGFERWRRYVLGVDDGVEKTPEWAEKKCAVPAETIRSLAQLIAKTKPAWLECHWGVSRRSRGENTARAFAALQAMMGYWGTPGAGPPLNLGPYRPIPLPRIWGGLGAVTVEYGPMGKYKVPSVYRSHWWAEAVLLLDKVRSGELSEKDYMRMVGWRADPSILKDFNPKMLLWGGGYFGSNHLVTACESSNRQVAAMERMEFIVSMQSRITPTARYADIILPALDPMWEEKNIVIAKRGFESINYCAGVVRPPGEVKPRLWFFCKLAERLGIDPRRIFSYYTTDDDWDKAWERYQMGLYQATVDHYKKQGVSIPSWEEFTKGKFINCDELDDEPFTGFDKQIKEGKPFETESGKIEFYSDYIAGETNRGKGEHYDTFGRLNESLASDWGALTPISIYQDAVRGMDDPMVKKYPLLMMAAHCRYRVHSVFWDSPWLRGQVYQHRVWISITDAKARGIKDGDLIQVYNDRGKAVMPAYVTSRIMPGLILLRHGGWYTPDESGVDFGASPSTLLGGDFTSCITPAKASSVVQVEKYEGELP